MKNLESMAYEFRFKFEKFMLGCESAQEIEHWNIERFGEMDAFYSNELTILVLKLVVSDGQVSHKEVEFINNLFGFDYSVEKLVELCSLSHEEVSYYVDEELDNGMALLQRINKKLASFYRDLMLLLCEIIIACDGDINVAELTEAKKLRAILDD